MSGVITAGMVEAARAYDCHHHQGGNWNMAPASQIQRLLTGAYPLIAADIGARLRAEIADEVTAICAETVLEAVAAERERIAADLNRRAEGLDEILATDPDPDVRTVAVTLRNTAWAIVHGDEAVNEMENPHDRP